MYIYPSSPQVKNMKLRQVVWDLPGNVLECFPNIARVLAQPVHSIKMQFGRKGERAPQLLILAACPMANLTMSNSLLTGSRHTLSSFPVPARFASPGSSHPLSKEVRYPQESICAHLCVWNGGKDLSRMYRSLPGVSWGSPCQMPRNQDTEWRPGHTSENSKCLQLHPPKPTHCHERLPYQ